MNVFFDLDGTLADTDADIRLAWKAAIADLSLDCPEFDRVFVAGPPIDEMTRTLFPELYSEELVSSIRERYAAHYDNDGFPSTKEYPGMIDAVRAIKAGGARVFIATNKRYRGTLKMAEKFGWNSLFEGVYSGDMHMDDPAIGKMNKTALLRFAMAETGSIPGTSVMVGDTENDFRAARETGMKSIGVSWGYGTGNESPDCWVRTPEELVQAVLRQS